MLIWLGHGAVLQSDSTIITYDTYSIGDIIGVALDLDNNRLYFSKNGVFQNSSNPANGTNPISITAPDSMQTIVVYILLVLEMVIQLTRNRTI